MRKMTKVLLGAVALPAALAASGVSALRAACGPCRPKAANPCSPCAAKKAASPCNPCAARRARSPCNPCAAKNPCNPCSAAGLPAPTASDLARPAGVKRFRANREALVRLGEKLYGDTSLSTNEMSCNSCHTDFSNYNETFNKPYPHFVQMPKDVSSVDEVNAEQMVQFCMMRPMMSKPLSWDSKELAALTAYVEEQQKLFAKR